MACTIMAAAQFSYAQVVRYNLGGTTVQEEKISPKVKQEMEQYAEKIRTIVHEEKAKMESEISAISKDISEHTILETAGQERKTEVSKKYAERINQRIRELGFNLDDVIKKQVEYAMLEAPAEVDNITIKGVKKAYAQVREVQGYLSWGVMSLSNDQHQGLNDHLGFSSNLEAGFIGHYQPKLASPVQFLSGLYLSWRTTRLDDDFLFFRNNGEVGISQHMQNLEKSKLRGTYLMMPLGIKFSPFAKLSGTGDSKYRNVRRGLAVGANLYGGVRISNNNIVKGGDVEFRDKSTSYNLNSYVYGSQFTLSWDNINIFVRQDFSPYFRAGTFDDRKMLQFGLNFGF